MSPRPTALGGVKDGDDDDRRGALGGVEDAAIATARAGVPPRGGWDGPRGHEAAPGRRDARAPARGRRAAGPRGCRARGCQAPGHIACDGKKIGHCVRGSGAVDGVLG